MEPLSMNTLASSLPSAQQQAQANDLSAKFKDAALAITTLYRASTAAQKRAHNAGYSAALQDILAFIRGGLSDGAVMDVGTVMDYAEARASAIADDDEEDAPAPPPVAPKVQSRLGNKAAASPQTITQSTTLSAKENRRRKHSSASPSPPPSAIAPMPISVATSVSAPTPGKMKLQDSSRAPSPVVGMKRRHQSTLADNLGFGFGMSNTLQPTNGEPSQRIKKGKPKSSRVPNPAIPPVATLFGLGVEEDMDVEEERPRKRR